MKKIFILILLFGFTHFGCSENEIKLPKQTKNQTTSIHFQKDGELSFSKSNGDVITTVDIEIADTEEKRTTGLMFREKMDENQAMLFVFPREEYQSFWMKNTIISLDMIFVNAKREIVNIQKNTTPYSTQSYPSTEPATYVIETIAGFSDKFNLEPGDKINWRLTR